MSLKTHFPIRKRTSLNNYSENSLPSKSIGVKRALFGKADTFASPKKARLDDENVISGSDKSKSPTKSLPNFIKAKQAFHISLPNRIIGRSKEMSDLHSFLSDHINGKKPGSLYLSGAPGTGKTSSLMFVKKGLLMKFNFVFINCTTINTPTAIFKSIAKEFGLPSKLINSKNVSDHVKNHIVKSSVMNVIVLDEIDHLDTKGQQVLYSLFEWPHLPKSTLILIGIANALDLTDRVLPLLKTFKYQPKLMHFLPYTKEQIISILEDRLLEAQEDGTPIIKPMAIQLCARKIAASTGDIRKALDICRRAIEIVETKVKPVPTLQQTSDDRCNPGSPRKRISSLQYVDLQEINAVLHEVFGSRLQASSIISSETVTIPLQQMILLCTLVLMKKYCKPQNINLGSAYDTYKRICSKRHIIVGDESSFHGLCKLVESRGFIELKPFKVPRLTKVILKMADNEIEHVLQDKAILSSVLSDCSVLNRKE